MDSRKFIWQQTGIVALGETVCVAAMIGIFAMLGYYDSTVLLGGVAGGVVATLNFFFMAIGATIAADKATEQNVKGGQATIKTSYLLRMVGMFVVLFALVKSGYCNVFSLVLPLIFVRFILTMTEFFRRKPGEKNG